MLGRGRGRGRGRVSPGSPPESASGSSGASSPAPPPGGLQIDVEAERLRALSLSGESDSCFSSRSASASRLGSEPSPGSAYAVQPSKALEKPVNLAPRPDFGREGQRIALLTNHFVVNLPQSDLKFYHYDVQITEYKETPNKSEVSIDWTGLRVPRYTRDEVRDTAYKVFAKCADVHNFGENFFTMVYDRQSHIYTSVYTPKIDKEVTWDGRRFRVKLTPNLECPFVVVSKASLHETVFEKPAERDRAPLQILDILHNQMLYFKRYLEKSNYVPHGRCFYKPLPPEKEAQVNLGMGRRLKEGFVKSLRIVAGNPTDLHASQYGFTLTMNIDVKLSPFFMEQRLDTTAANTLRMNTAPGRDGLSENDVMTLRKHFADLRVRTLHTNRVFTIRTVSKNPATRETFLDDKGQKISVADYFAENYGPLKYSTLQCVIDERGRFIPMELCTVLPNQKVDLKKMTPDQSREIIKNAAVFPEIRRNDIIAKSKELSGGNGDVSTDDRFLNHLQIGRSLQMMKVDGRVLKHPVVEYNNESCRVEKGSWTLSQQHRFLAPATVTNFIVVCFSPQEQLKLNIIDQFIRGLRDKASKMGMEIPEQCVWGNYIGKDELLSQIETNKTKHNINLAICIMDETRQPLLKNHVKLCEQKTSVATQCILSRTVKKSAGSGSGMLFENIALKLNLKCGGINNFISLLQDKVAQEWFKDDVMFVGMDVNHPPPLSKREIAMNIVPLKPSVVGAVANVGKHVAMYAMQVKTQDARREAISDDNMRSIFSEFIDQFQENRKKRPQRIVVYRDGVSESQFAMVLQQEALFMKNTFAKYDGDYQPKLTIITAQKRHNTRFFLENINTGSRRVADKNIPAGTVVDTGPVSAYQFEFFLASQAGIQGTTKAPNYVVIYDDNKFSQDELQRLTFLLCHVYQRATKSVSLPAPCYFAHHAATRGKELVDAYLNLSDDSSSVSSSESRLPDFDRINENIKYNRDFGGTGRMLFL